MHKDRTVKIVAACLIGLLVSAGYLFRMHRIRDQIAGLDRAVEVLTARYPLKIGNTLSEDMFSSRKVPVSHLSKRAMTADDLPLILGQALVHPIPEGDLLLWSDLSDGPRLRYPTERIPEGYRSFALPADEIHTLTHLISPGDRVDVLWTHFPTGSARPSSQILAEALPVMAVGRLLEITSPSERFDEIPASVTLLVTEAQALLLASASTSGEVSLLARTRGTAARIQPEAASAKTGSVPDGGPRP